MTQNLTSTILSQGRSATRKELQILFRGLIPDVHSLSEIITDKEMTRIICLYLFYQNCIEKDRPRSLIVHQLAQVGGVTKKTIRTWVSDFYQLKFSDVSDECESPI